MHDPPPSYAPQRPPLTPLTRGVRGGQDYAKNEQYEMVLSTKENAYIVSHLYSTDYAVQTHKHAIGQFSM